MKKARPTRPARRRARKSRKAAKKRGSQVTLCIYQGGRASGKRFRVALQKLTEALRAPAHPFVVGMAAAQVAVSCMAQNIKMADNCQRKTRAIGGIVPGERVGGGEIVMLPDGSHVLTPECERQLAEVIRHSRVAKETIGMPPPPHLPVIYGVDEEERRECIEQLSKTPGGEKQS